MNITFDTLGVCGVVWCCGGVVGVWGGSVVVGVAGGGEGVWGCMLLTVIVKYVQFVRLCD